MVELVLENDQDTIQDLSIALELFVKTVPNIAHVQLGYSSVCVYVCECVCVVDTKIRDRRSQKFMFGGGLTSLVI
jgi:hypothetical protein